MEEYGDALTIVLILEGTYIIYKIFLENTDIDFLIKGEKPVEVKKTREPITTVGKIATSIGVAGAVTGAIAGGTYAADKLRKNFVPLTPY